MKPISSAFRLAVRGSHGAAFRARVLTTFQTGVDPDGTEVDILAGNVRLDGTAAVRATLDLTTAGRDSNAKSLWPANQQALLGPFGNELFVERGIAGLVTLTAPVVWRDRFDQAAQLDVNYDTEWEDAKTAAGSVNGDGTATFQSNEGTAYAIRDDIDAAEVDVTVGCAGNTQIRRRWGIAARVPAGWGVAAGDGTIDSGYGLLVQNDGVVRLTRNGSNVDTAPEFNPGVDFLMRLRVVGSLVQGKFWVATDPEPGTWGVEHTDGSPLAAGKAGFGVHNSGNRATTFNGPLVVTDLGNTNTGEFSESSSPGPDAPARAPEWVPLGYFRIYAPEQRDAPDGPIRVTGRDRMSGIIDARLTSPQQFTAGTSYEDIVTDLVTEVYPAAEFDLDQDFASSTISRGVVVERDRYEFLADLVTADGKVMYFDHRGVLVVTTPPDPGSPVFTVDDGAQGVLVELSRNLSRDGVYNAVVAEGEDANDEPVRAVRVDDNPASATYYFGKFGKVPRFYASTFITTSTQATSAADSLLRRTTGLPYSVDFGMVPNPALEPDDPITVTFGSTSETHVIETMVVPLTADRHITGTTREKILFIAGEES